MMIFFVGVYLLLNVLIGFVASRRVKNSTDFVLAGRNMSVMVASVGIFATWFGSETIMSSSVEFAKGGFLAVIKDPFGAALCLFLIGTFFTKKLYKTNIVTFSDYFNLRYGRIAELVSVALLSFSYVFWIAAQLKAMGFVLSSLTEGYDFFISPGIGVFIGAFLIAVYTAVGGMWAVSITDFVQTLVILAGLVFITVILLGEVGGLANAVAAQPPGFFKAYPAGDFSSIMAYLAAWMSVGFGGIAQQDVFQRTMSTRSPNAARNAAYAASLMYLTIALFPLIIGMCSRILPGENGALMVKLIQNESTSNQMLPMLAKLYTPVWVQIVFFGALVSAIMSTASGAILAPATVIAENLIRPVFKDITDKGLLFFLRLSVWGIALVSAFISITGESIYNLAASASVITLVSLLIPLVAGLYWKSANKSGAILSMVLGAIFWVIFEYDLVANISEDWMPMFAGWGASIAGMVVGSLLFEKKNKNNKDTE